MIQITLNSEFSADFHTDLVFVDKPWKWPSQADLCPHRQTLTFVPSTRFQCLFLTSGSCLFTAPDLLPAVNCSLSSFLHQSFSIHRHSRVTDLFTAAPLLRISRPSRDGSKLLKFAFWISENETRAKPFLQLNKKDTMQRCEGSKGFLLQSHLHPGRI